MNASCLRVNKTDIWRMLCNLGESSGWLGLGLGLPHVARIAICGPIPSSDLTATIKYSAALCFVISFI